MWKALSITFEVTTISFVVPKPKQWDIVSTFSMLLSLLIFLVGGLQSGHCCTKRYMLAVS